MPLIIPNLICNGIVVEKAVRSAYALRVIISKEKRRFLLPKYSLVSVLDVYWPVCIVPYNEKALIIDLTCTYGARLNVEGQTIMPIFPNKEALDILQLINYSYDEEIDGIILPSNISQEEALEISSWINEISEQTRLRIETTRRSISELEIQRSTETSPLYHRLSEVKRVVDSMHQLEQSIESRINQILTHNLHDSSGLSTIYEQKQRAEAIRKQAESEQKVLENQIESINRRYSEQIEVLQGIVEENQALMTKICKILLNHAINKSIQLYLTFCVAKFVKDSKTRYRVFLPSVIFLGLSFTHNYLKDTGKLLTKLMKRIQMSSNLNEAWANLASVAERKGNSYPEKEIRKFYEKVGENFCLMKSVA